ncbi:MAG: HD domain-containing protein [Desulfuromonadales bacterium]|nr:HD domain-containing protein [Desulfuromonadales bacterium]
MDQSCLDALVEWFDGYVHPYYDTDSEGVNNIRMKVEHTRKVCGVMAQLASGEGLSPHDRCLAGAVALLHDVGRFPQYRRWRTFRDSLSDNHARLAVEVIREQNLLDGLHPEDCLLIEEAVRFHNLLSVPRVLKSPTDLFLRLIRDADKLDIWRVFIDFFSMPVEERASAALLGLPDRDEITMACVTALANRQVVRLDTVACVNDFKLLLISWTFDLNYGSSYQLLNRSNYLESLADGIPDSSAVRDALAMARDYVAAKSCLA